MFHKRGQILFLDDFSMCVWKALHDSSHIKVISMGGVLCEQLTGLVHKRIHSELSSAIFRILRLTHYFVPRPPTVLPLFTTSSIMTAVKKELPASYALSMIRIGLSRLNQH